MRIASNSRGRFMGWMAKIPHIVVLVGIGLLLWMPYRLKFLRWLLWGKSAPQKKIRRRKFQLRGLAANDFHTNAGQ
jgi:hypothetical protein